MRARAIVRDERLTYDYLFWTRSKRLRKPLDQYDQLTLLVFLDPHEMKAAFEWVESQAYWATRSENEPEATDAWDTPHLTGDPVVDRWEAEIALGRTPDWSTKP